MVDQERREIVLQHDKLLRKFEYSRALDQVLKPYVMRKKPVKIEALAEVKGESPASAPPEKGERSAPLAAANCAGISMLPCNAFTNCMICFEYSGAAAVDFAWPARSSF